MKLNVPQLFFTAAFAATVMTACHSFVDWDHHVYAGIFAGIAALAGAMLSKVIFKNED